MTPYYRAYLLRDLHRFPQWTHEVLPAGHGLPDDTVVYLRDDLSVVRSPVQADQEVLWDAPTLEWREFCEATLRFEVPVELRPERA